MSSLPPPTAAKLGADGAAMGADPSQQQRQQQLQQLSRRNLSREEAALLKSCNRDSFYQRSLPLSLLGALLAKAGIKAGRLTPHPSYGAAPKMVLAGLLGFFAGKISYAQVCSDRFVRELPNCPTSYVIKKSRGQLTPEDEARLEELRSSWMAAQQEQQPGGGQDYFEGGQSGADAQAPPAVAGGGGATYDDVRRAYRQQHGQGAAPPPSYAPPPPAIPPTQDPSYAPPSKLRRPAATNKYGDEGFE